MTVLVLAQSLCIVNAASSSIKAQANICKSAGYSELVPLLQLYDAAQAYCAKSFPAQCIAGKPKARRLLSISPSSLLEVALKPRANAKSQDQNKARVSALSRAKKQHKDVQSTICSCIQSHKVISNIPTREPTNRDRLVLRRPAPLQSRP